MLRDPVSDPPPEFVEVWIVFGAPATPVGWRGYRIGDAYYRSARGDDVRIGAVGGWRLLEEGDPVGAGRSL